jgi:Rod binding domain-containing protein
MNVLGTVAAQSNSTSVPQPHLVRAAHEFEAQLMKELLKPMTSSTSLDGDGADQGSGGALADFAADALGQALSARGGLGIATNILHSLSRSGKDSQASSNVGAETRVSSPAGAAGFK